MQFQYDSEGRNALLPYCLVSIEAQHSNLAGLNVLTPHMVLNITMEEGGLLIQHDTFNKVCEYLWKKTYFNISDLGF